MLVSRAVRPGVTLASPAADDPHVTDPFDRLFLQEYPKVVAVAYRVLGDRAAAEDVAQEVFLKFHRQHSAQQAYAVGWLRAAAAHAALNVLRTDRRRARRETAAASLEQGSPDHPESVVVTAELRRDVRGALARLPMRSAAILALRYSGFSYAEVASALGIRVGNVGTMLRRAEEALRKEVKRGTSQ